MSFPVPGTSAAVFNARREILWGSDNSRLVAVYGGGVLSSTTRDATNDITTVLRPGLVLGIITSTGEYVHYDPDAVDGSENAVAVLANEVNVLDAYGVATDRLPSFLLSGLVRASQLLGLDAKARQQLARQFLFDDDLNGQLPPFPVKELVAANTAVTAAKNGYEYIVNGGTGVTFTLPTLAVGLRYRFFNGVAQNMIIASAAGDDIIGPGDVDLDSISYNVAGELIGAACEFESVYMGTASLKWLFRTLCVNHFNTTD